MERGGVVYIMTNLNNTTLYIGVTSDLSTRIQDHRINKYPNSFTSRYKLYKLVYYELFHSIEEAIGREKQLKAGNRQRKIHLIEGINPDWKDLYDEVKKW